MFDPVHGTPSEVYVLIALLFWAPLTVFFRNPVVAAMVAAPGALIVCYLASVFTWWIVAGLPMCLVAGVMAVIYFKDYAGR
jgi:hypothetical protein